VYGASYQHRLRRQTFHDCSATKKTATDRAIWNYCNSKFPAQVKQLRVKKATNVKTKI